MPRPRISDDLKQRVHELAGTSDGTSFAEALENLVEGVEKAQRRRQEALDAQRQQQARQQPQRREDVARQIRREFSD